MDTKSMGSGTIGATGSGTLGRIHFFFPTVWNRMFDGWSRSRALSLPVRVPGKKLTDRRRWPAVTQHEVLILTRDIMSLQSTEVSAKVSMRLVPE